MPSIFEFFIILSEVLLFTYRTLHSLNLFYIPVISGHLAFEVETSVWSQDVQQTPSHSLVQYKIYVRQDGWNMTVNKNFCIVHVHWRIYKLLTLHVVIVHKMCDRIRQLKTSRPSVLLFRQVKECGCVQRRTAVWCAVKWDRLTEEFATAKFTVILCRKEASENAEIFFGISMR
jgi:hypothetical protein